MHQVYQEIVGSVANVFIGFDTFFKSAQRLLLAILNKNMLSKEFCHIDA